MTIHPKSAMVRLFFLSTAVLSSAAVAQGIKIDPPIPPKGCQFVSAQVNPGQSFHGKKCVTNTNGCLCSGQFCAGSKGSRGQYKNLKCSASPG